MAQSRWFVKASQNNESVETLELLKTCKAFFAVVLKLKLKLATKSSLKARRQLFKGLIEHMSVSFHELSYQHPNLAI